MIDKYQDFLTQNNLISRGWKKSEIEGYLIKPDFEMRYRGSGFYYKSHLYDMETVAKVEAQNKMELGSPLVNTRHNYVFWEDLYNEGWTETQLKTLLPTPTLIRNWDAGTATATLKVWNKNEISHELAFAVSSSDKEKSLARRKKMAETKLATARAEKAKELEIIKAAQKKSEEDFLKAIAQNNPQYFLKYIGNDNRVVVISERHGLEIKNAAADLGFTTNTHSNKFGNHWSFGSAEKRDLFAMELVDYLARSRGLIKDDDDEAIAA